LNVYASIDLAFSTKLRSDYTAIVVVGVDPDSNIYVLDIDRFRTEKMSECYERLRDLHVKWSFRKLRAEMVVAQAAVIREIRDMYIKPAGLSLSIEEYYPTRHMGTKEERVRAILQPRYDNLAMWHYRGGNCQVLEEELLQRHPAHDDVKDALASCVEIAVPPSHKLMRTERKSNVVYHSRFGGISI
jgi:phage terminase large subunit-like protein